MTASLLAFSAVGLAAATWWRLRRRDDRWVITDRDLERLRRRHVRPDR